MSATGTANGIPRSAGSPARQVQAYARIGGLLLLVSVVAGSFGEMYVPSHFIVAGDASATARNILASPLLFRVGFASYLVEAMCDIVLALLFYALLKPVQRDLALLSAFFGLVATAVFAVAELFCFAALVPLAGAGTLRSFSPDQLDTLAFLGIRLYSVGAVAFLAFYGVASVLRGWLIYRSGYLPGALGVLLMLGGAGFIARNLVFVLAPAHDSPALLLPMAVAGIPLTVWLLAKGIDVAKWTQATAARHS